ETASQLPPANEVPPLVISTSEQTKTEQYTLSHEKYEKAVAYSRAGYTLYFLSYILGGLFLFLILRLGIAARFRDIAESASQRRWVQGLVFVPLLVLLVDVLDLPVRLYWHRLSLHYEQSVQGWGSWFWDWTKEELVGIAIAVVLVLVLFAVMRFSPRRWWLLFWFPRSEEHTSELQSRFDLVCRLLLEKKKNTPTTPGPQDLYHFYRPIHITPLQH